MILFFKTSFPTRFLLFSFNNCYVPHDLLRGIHHHHHHYRLHDVRRILGLLLAGNLLVNSISINIKLPIFYHEHIPSRSRLSYPPPPPRPPRKSPPPPPRRSNGASIFSLIALIAS